jgi:predicted DNA-binding transcriptional regulator AlpA
MMTSQRQFAELNERHATLVMQYLPRTRATEGFIMRMVDEFVSARAQRQIEPPPTPPASPGAVMPVEPAAVVAIARPLSGTLRIADLAIRTDADGRYCLNDLHRAAGEEQRHRPKYWLEGQSAQGLVAELEIGAITPIQTKQGLGTFVCKELVYAYAMWISPSFHLKVIRAYDELVTRGAPTPALPDFTDPAAAAIAWAEQYRARRALERQIGGGAVVQQLPPPQKRGAQSNAVTLENFDRLPDGAYVRLTVVASLLQISPTTVRRYVRDGILPAPIPIGQPRWNVGDIRAALEMKSALRDAA